MYVYYNPEDLYNLEDACVPRAMNCAFNTHFKNIIGIKEKWRQALIDAGFTYVSIPAKPFQKRMTVKELSETCDKNSLILCSCADHVVCIKNNNYYDIADSGNRCVFFYFERRMKEC